MSVGVGRSSGKSSLKSKLGRPQLALLLVAFWVGFNLRASLLGVPPILGLARTSYHLSYEAAGLVTALPILAFGVMAFPGAS